VAEIIVAPSARTDLLAQWDFYADEVGDPDLADRFVASAEASFKKLARTPGLGRPRLLPGVKAKNLRSWRVADFPKHLIFYRQLPEERGVEIIRVLHGARDLDAVFGA
jgi:toxin ParE1/3/4